MKKVLIVGSLVFLAVSCTEAAVPVNTEKPPVVEVVAPVEGQKTHSDDSITFNYPSDWELSTSTGIVMVTSPEKEGDDFAENINFLSQEYASSKLDFDGFIAANIENIQQMLKQANGKLLTEGEDVKIHGYDAKKYVYKFDMYGITAHTTQYYIDKNGTGYLITVTESPETVGDFKKEFDSILDSYVVK